VNFLVWLDTILKKKTSSVCTDNSLHTSKIVNQENIMQKQAEEFERLRAELKSYRQGN
jgi:hypothetical protein